jgi:hypothetical protein
MSFRPGARGALPAAPSAAATGHDCRCGCGSLLARLRPGGVELKCRRCKRVVMLPLAGLLTGEGSEAQSLD